MNRTDIRGYSALHKAVKLGNEDIIKMLLLNGGAKTGIQGHRLKTPLHYANDPTTVRLLMESTECGRGRYPSSSESSPTRTPTSACARTGSSRADPARTLV